MKIRDWAVAAYDRNEHDEVVQELVYAHVRNLVRQGASLDDEITHPIRETWE